MSDLSFLMVNFTVKFEREHRERGRRMTDGSDYRWLQSGRTQRHYNFRYPVLLHRLWSHESKSLSIKRKPVPVVSRYYVGGLNNK